MLGVCPIVQQDSEKAKDRGEESGSNSLNQRYKKYARIDKCLVDPTPYTIMAHRCQICNKKFL